MILRMTDCKYFAKWAVSYKVLEDRAYKIALNSKYDGYQIGFTSMACNFSDK